MKRAQVLAWNLYMLRLQSIADEQRRQFEKGHPSTRMVMEAPSLDAVKLIESTCRDAANEARESVVLRVLGPMVKAIDAIDNSRGKAKKTPAITELYEALTESYDELHKIKDELAALKKEQSEVAEPPQ